MKVSLAVNTSLAVMAFAIAARAQLPPMQDLDTQDHRQEQADTLELHSRTIRPLNEVAEVAEDLGHGANPSSLDDAIRPIHEAHDRAHLVEVEAVAPPVNAPSLRAVQQGPTRAPPTPFEALVLGSSGTLHPDQAEHAAALIYAEVARLERKRKNSEHDATYRAKVRADSKKRLEKKRKRADYDAQHYAAIRQGFAERKKPTRKSMDARNARKRENRRMLREAQGLSVRKYDRRATAAAQSSDEVSLHHEAAVLSTSNTLGTTSRITSATGSTTSLPSSSHAHAHAQQAADPEPDTLHDEAWIDEMLDTVHAPHFDHDRAFH